MRTPSPARLRYRPGNAPPPFATRYAGPVIGPGSMGVSTLASPISDACGQAAGLAANVACGQALCSVLSRAGSCVGSVVAIEAMFASCASGRSSSMWKPTPVALELCTLVVLAIDGLNGSEPHWEATKGVEIAWPAPAVELSWVAIVDGAQSVGLSMKPLRET